MKNVFVFLLSCLIFSVSGVSYSSVPDFDDSGQVDIADLVHFSGEWLNTTSAPENLDGIDRVDMADFSIFSSWWQKFVPPTAVPEGYYVVRDGSLSISAPGVLANDTGAGTLTAILETDVSHGSLTLNSIGSFTYTPDPGYAGPDYFTYRVSNGDKSNTASVSLTVDSGETNSWAPVSGLLNGDFESAESIPTTDRFAAFVAPPWQRNFQNIWLVSTTIGGRSTQCLRARWANTYAYQDIPVSAGRAYHLSFDSLQVSGNTTVRPQLEIEWLTESMDTIGYTTEAAHVEPAGTGPDAGIWITRTGELTAPPLATYARIRVGTGGSSSATIYLDNVTMEERTFPTMGTMARLDAYPYDNSGSPAIVAASQAAGHYAVADTKNDTIEIRDIRGELLNTIDVTKILAAAPDLDLSGDHYGPCSLAFTSSGRLLFIGICSASGSGDKDAVLRYNLTLDELIVFDRLEIAATLFEPVCFGLAHYTQNLFVGTEDTLYRYQAGRNDRGSEPFETLSLPGSAQVVGLAVDMMDRTDPNWTPRLYVASPTDLYRVDIVDGSLSLGNSVASTTDIRSISFSQVFGAMETRGLHVLRNDGTSSSIEIAGLADLRDGGTVTLNPYVTLGADVLDIASTACGRMMLATPSPQMLSDASDPLLDFESWVQAEFDQNKAAIWDQSTPYQDDLLPGTSLNILYTLGSGQGSYPRTGTEDATTGWAPYSMMIMDRVSPDPQYEQWIAQGLLRRSGLHPDGIDYPYAWVDIDGIHSDWGDEGFESSVYYIMKLLPQAYLSTKLYPDNQDIAASYEKINSQLKRQSDHIWVGNNTSWKHDQYGPRSKNGLLHEVRAYAEMVAAQDPWYSEEYKNGVRDYNEESWSIRYDKYLIDQPCTDDLPYFTIGGGTMMSQHFLSDDAWWTQNLNYVDASAAVGDEYGIPWHAAFNAGPTPTLGYSGDGPSKAFKKQELTIHFPAALAFASWGRISPAVGAYKAYRDGLTMLFETAPGSEPVALLGRWSYLHPEWRMARWGLTDYYCGATGLAELLRPGTTEEIAQPHYMPTPVVSMIDGRQRIDFSKYTRRRILGSDDGGLTKVSYGFQFAPFDFDTGVMHSNYYVVDPEGQWTALPNHDFEDGLTNWTQSGDYEFSVLESAGESIVGKSAEIRTTTSSSDPESSLRQTLDLSFDLDNTRYRIRADGFALLPSSAGTAYLRLKWDDNDNPGNGVLSTEQSTQIVSASNLRDEFRIDTVKPVNGGYLHIELVVEMGSTEDGRFLFDNVSVIMMGTVPQAMAGGDAETGSFSSEWSNNDPGEITITSDPGEVISGSHSFKWEMTNTMTHTADALYTLDVSSDPLNERYVLRFDANATQMNSSTFDVRFASYDITNTIVYPAGKSPFPIERIYPGTDGEVIVTFRKRPECDHIELSFEMTREDGAAGTDTVIIDNLWISKERTY